MFWGSSENQLARLEWRHTLQPLIALDTNDFTPSTYPRARRYTVNQSLRSARMTSQALTNQGACRGWCHAHGVVWRYGVGINHGRDWGSGQADHQDLFTYRSLVSLTISPQPRFRLPPLNLNLSFTVRLVNQRQTMACCSTIRSLVVLVMVLNVLVFGATIDRPQFRRDELQQESQVRLLLIDIFLIEILSSRRL